TDVTPHAETEPLQQTVTREGALRLVRYRPLFSGPAVERVPELLFQRAHPEVQLFEEDARERGIGDGDTVTVTSNGTSRALRARPTRGRLQTRHGPNRAGPYGLLQPLADLIKLIRKESFFPEASIDAPYILAPIVSMFTALAAFSVIPFGAGWKIWHYHVNGE